MDPVACVLGPFAAFFQTFIGYTKIRKYVFEFYQLLVLIMTTGLSWTCIGISGAAQLGQCDKDYHCNGIIGEINSQV